MNREAAAHEILFADYLTQLDGPKREIRGARQNEKNLNVYDEVKLRAHEPRRVADIHEQLRTE
jgi:hypothetical protein